MTKRLSRMFKDECATQIAEFALSLPVLVLLVVGIFDFSSAITLKQKLTNASMPTRSCPPLLMALPLHHHHHHHAPQSNRRGPSRLGVVAQLLLDPAI